MQLYYNGITLKNCQVRQLVREKIYHGPTWIYDRWLIHVAAIFNPEMVSFEPIPVTPPNIIRAEEARPKEISNIEPVYTDRVLRARLSVPRKRLVLYQWTITPKDKFFPIILWVQGLDANNGPLVLRADVSEIYGTKTFKVEFIVQTDVRETLPSYYDLGGEKMIAHHNWASALLSHRWTQECIIDEQLMSTVITKGTAIFRTDILNLLNHTPDDFRELLALVPPPGHRRRESRWAVREPNVLDYVIIDTQESYYCGSGRILKAEIIENNSLIRSSAFDTMMRIGSSLLTRNVGIRENNKPQVIEIRSGETIEQYKEGNTGTSVRT